MYLQSIHLTRLLSRLITVKPQQSEWLNTELFSAECGSTLKTCRVASANLVLYPTIIPGCEARWSSWEQCDPGTGQVARLAAVSCLYLALSSHQAVPTARTPGTTTHHAHNVVTPGITLTTTVMTADNLTGEGGLLIHGRLCLDNFNCAAGVWGSASPQAGTTLLTFSSAQDR